MSMFEALTRNDEFPNVRFASGHAFTFDATHPRASTYTQVILEQRGPEFYIIRDGCPRGWSFAPCILLEAVNGDWVGYVPESELFIIGERP